MRLALAFAHGKVSGSGVDLVGRFTIDGQHGADNAEFLKHYPRHTVKYVGKWDGAVLYGTWAILRTRLVGEFELWPEDEEQAIDSLTHVTDVSMEIEVAGRS